MAERWLRKTRATKSTTAATRPALLLQHNPPPAPRGHAAAVPALPTPPRSWLIDGEEEELPHRDAQALLLRGDLTLVAL